MLPLLENKVVFVSGGSQGLGAAIARAAAREGAEAVVVTGRRPEPGEKLVAELAERAATARFVQADVSDVAQAQAAVATAVDEFGRVDCLVNSAGLTARGTLLDTTPELFDAHIAREPARPVLHDAGGRARHGPPQGARDHRQRHLDRRARRPALPRAVRRGQGRARGH